ncbi:hypothetical protein ACPV5S_15800 [Vibrio astriarenae]
MPKPVKQWQPAPRGRRVYSRKITYARLSPFAKQFVDDGHCYDSVAELDWNELCEGDQDHFGSKFEFDQARAEAALYLEQL